MAVLALLLLVGFSFDWAKTCKPVNYKFKQYKAQQYGYGCKKGCFGYANRTAECCDAAGNNCKSNCVDASGRIGDGDHYKQEKCVECEKIDSSFVVAYYMWQSYGQYGPPTGMIVTINNTEMEKACNGQTSYMVTDNGGSISYPRSPFSGAGIACSWNGKKCKANSCPRMVSRGKCNGNWTNGKCVKNKGGTCLAEDWDFNFDFPGNFWDSSYSGRQLYFSDVDKSGNSGCSGILRNGSSNVVNQNYPSNSDYQYVVCDDLDKYYHTQRSDFKDAGERYDCVKFTSDHVKECNYQCEKKNTYTKVEKYEYTKADRKECHQLYGCLYAGGNPNNCSTWSIWAFVVTLVLLILLVVGAVVGVVIVVLHFVLKLF